MLHNDLLNL